MTQTRYDNFGGSSGGSDSETRSDAVQLIKPTTFTEIEFSLGHVAGTESQFGQSLMTIFQDVEIVDGALYADVEKDKVKLFSWKSLTGFHPEEWYFERDDPLVASDADEIVSKDYNVAQKTYELIAARVPPIQEEGEVVQEATSVRRPWGFSNDELTLDGEIDTASGDPVETRDMIIFWDASKDNGPNVRSTRTAEVLSSLGTTLVGDDDDWMNWLTDTSGDNLARPDLEGERVRLAVISRESEESGFSYDYPVYMQADTGSQLYPYEREGGDTEQSGDSGNEESGGSALTEARKADEGEWPEPIADFLQSGRTLNLNEERADNLLDELVGDETNPLTQEMVDDFGGREELIEAVV